MRTVSRLQCKRSSRKPLAACLDQRTYDRLLDGRRVGRDEVTLELLDVPLDSLGAFGLGLGCLPTSRLVLFGPLAAFDPADGEWPGAVPRADRPTVRVGSRPLVASGRHLW